MDFYYLEVIQTEMRMIYSKKETLPLKLYI